MFCSKCGKQIEDSTEFCSYCGAKVNGAQNNQNNQNNLNNLNNQNYQNYQNNQNFQNYQNFQNNQNSPITDNGPSHHTIPKCNYCGNIEEWQVGPLFRPMDYVVGVALLLLGFIPGLVYMGVVGLIRSNKDNREKICKKCGAKNMFTNLY